MHRPPTSAASPWGPPTHGQPYYIGIFKTKFKIKFYYNNIYCKAVIIIIIHRKILIAL